MKLKPTIKGMKNLQTMSAPKKAQENKLPPDGYRPMFEPVKILVREAPSRKDCTSLVKQYMEISVKRFDDDAAMPYVWLQMYQESEYYTGYLKGKSVYFPLEMFADMMEALQSVDDKCEELNITT